MDAGPLKTDIIKYKLDMNYANSTTLGFEKNGGTLPCRQRHGSNAKPRREPVLLEYPTGV